MDADCQKRQRTRIPPPREKRWSMNSQRLEEIVAELMKPISDIRRSFDMDLSALLEEYLTEAGLHALEAGEAGDSAVAVDTPNFAELALLLQQSASIYGRKVDFLYQHVLTVSDSLQNRSQETSNSTPEEAQTPSTSRRKRKSSSSSCSEFATIELESAAGSRREPGAPRPPPTLPRMYVELEPRVLHHADAPLLDYNGEPIGLLADFHVTWRLQEGLLVDELEEAFTSSNNTLRPIPLMELQAAIEAAAPPSPPRLDTPTPADDPHTPLPPADIAHTPPPFADGTHTPPTPHAEELSPLVQPVELARKTRKRKHDVNLDYIIGDSIKLRISEEFRRANWVREFSVSAEWVSAVVAARKRDILRERRRLHDCDTTLDVSGFRGFDSLDSSDIGGFLGWSSEEAARATVLARAGSSDSDDDGFFELSCDDSETSRVDADPAAPSAATTLNTTANTSMQEYAPEWWSWQARVLQHAEAAAARGAVDVRQLGTALLDRLPADRPIPFARVLADSAEDKSDVTRLLLTTLFLTNAGNVEILPGAPLSVNSFSVRVLSRDQRLYSAAAAAADQELLR